MQTNSKAIIQSQLKSELPDVKPGDTVRIYQKVKEDDKERMQMFEGIVLAKKHGRGISSTITVRRELSGVGVERIFPLHSPTINKIEIVKRSKVRRAKLYHLRGAKGKKSRLRKKEFEGKVYEETSDLPEKQAEKPTEREEKLEQAEENKKEIKETTEKQE